MGDSALRAGLSIRGEVWRGHWGALAELSRARVGGSISTGTVPGEAEPLRLEATMLEAAAGFRVGRVPSTSAVELLAGARYVRQVQEPDLSLPPRSGGTTKADWLEPFAGARFVSALGGDARFAVSGTIGGWGMGSDFAWELGGELGYRIVPHAELVGSYRYSESEYVEGGRYRWDGNAQGWTVGLGLDL